MRHFKYQPIVKVSSIKLTSCLYSSATETPHSMVLKQETKYVITKLKTNTEQEKKIKTAQIVGKLSSINTCSIFRIGSWTCGF